MEEDVVAEPLFRASKRRKVFRKREDSYDDTPSEAHEQQLPISNHPPALEDNGLAVPVYLQKKKPGSRKHGIGFTSTEIRRHEVDDGSNSETALALARHDEEQDVASVDRFVRPTGKVAVTEDKHMMAYVDSKLAEARGLTSDATTGSDDAMDDLAGSSDLPARTTSEAGVSTTTAVKTLNGGSTARTTQVKPTRASNRPPRRRGPAARAEADIARDSMIEQIMHEAQVPLYAQPSSKTAKTIGDAEEDKDAAIAEAFKAQLLEEMAMQNRRRPPKAAGKDAKVSTGPKLGGSRAQRERMKALEEAKAGSGVKK